MKIIAHVRTDFGTKFGVPRQSGIVPSLNGKIIFEPEYRNPDAIRGLEGFSYIWLIWKFSETARETWSPTVRPPRLGGEKRMGVFATRSPFRPNAIGLSSVALNRIELHSDSGPVLYVSGVDLVDNTPVYDIKPYLAYTDSHPEAAAGFTESMACHELKVHFPPEYLEVLPREHREPLLSVLAHDPRPRYQVDQDRSYGFEFAHFNIKFKVRDNILSVFSVSPL